MGAFLFQSTLPARGSDTDKERQLVTVDISIHAPRKGERRFNRRNPRADGSYFNPRSPQGGATMRSKAFLPDRSYFNPRSPQGGATSTPISTQNLRHLFQSTLPARGSDYAQQHNGKHHCISIHAPRKGERPRRLLLYADCPRFISIHAPRKGERRTILRQHRPIFIFQSTLPARGSDRIFSH